MKTEFKGGIPKAQGQLFLVLEFTLALTSILLMGRSWFRLYLFIAVLSLPGLLLAYYMLSSKNWFRLDDQNERIETPLRQSIPYGSLKAIHITEFDGRVSVSVRQGRLDKKPLVQNLKREEKWRLLEELKKRFPEEMLRETKLPQWKTTLGIYIAPIVPCLLLLIFTYYVTNRVPQVTVMPENCSLPMGFSSSQATEPHVLDLISFSLPEGFSIEEEKERSVLSEDVALKTDLRVHV
jgi:hypothetical protein